MTVQRYRKKPVVIEAWQLALDATTKEARPLANWCNGILRYTYRNSAQIPHVIIPTLEGEMTADPGDWIIRGVRGEFYPCKSDIFAATYERVADDDGPSAMPEVRGDE